MNTVNNLNVRSESDTFFYELVWVQSQPINGTAYATNEIALRLEDVTQGDKTGPNGGNYLVCGNGYSASGSGVTNYAGSFNQGYGALPNVNYNNGYCDYPSGMMGNLVHADGMTYYPYYNTFYFGNWVWNDGITTDGYKTVSFYNHNEAP